MALTVQTSYNPASSYMHGPMHVRRQHNPDSGKNMPRSNRTSSQPPPLPGPPTHHHNPFIKPAGRGLKTLLVACANTCMQLTLHHSLHPAQSHRATHHTGCAAYSRMQTQPCARQPCIHTTRLTCTPCHDNNNLPAKALGKSGRSKPCLLSRIGQ